jgi:hypothetical protein
MSAEPTLAATHLPGTKDNDLVWLSRHAIAHPDFRKSFIFGVGILPSIMFGLNTSIDRRIRGQLIRILRDIAPRREVVWDSLNIADMGERILEMEDKSHVNEIANKHDTNGCIMKVYFATSLIANS